MFYMAKRYSGKDLKKLYHNRRIMMYRASKGARNRVRNRWFLFFVLPAVLILFAVTIYPFIYCLTLSLKSFSTRTLQIGEFVGLANYASLFKEISIYQSIARTMIFTGISVLGSTLIALTLSLFLYRPFPGYKIFRSLFIIPMVMTPVVVGLTWKILYNPIYGFFNAVLRSIGLQGPNWLSNSSIALFSVILVDIWQWTPFLLLICLAGLDSLPLGPLEAASIDGATKFQIIRYIIIPLLFPTLRIAVLIRAIDAVKTFDIIYVLTRGGPGSATETLTLLGYLKGFQFFHLEVGAAISIVLLIILIPLVQFYIKLCSKKESGG